MNKEQQNKRLALALSVGLHVLIFGALAAGGIFTFLETKEKPPLEVTMYDDDATSTTPTGGGALAPATADDSSGGESYTVSTAAPTIDESFTAAVQKEREVKQVMQSQNVDALTAEKIVAEKTGEENGTAAKSTTNAVGNATPAASGAGANGPGESGSGSGQGQGQGAGNGKGNGQGTGNGGSGAAAAPPAKPVRPPQRARLISSPDASSYYPESLRKQNVAATVVLSLQISTSGSVTNATVTSSSGYPEMDAAATQLAYACQYDPARDENGNAVATTKGLTVPFSTQ